MKRTCLLTLLLCLLLTPALLNATPPAISAPAAPTTTSPFAYRGFSGGMMLHAGWVDCGDMRVGLAPVQRLSGLPLGIGGALKVRFGDHLRVGTEGYTSALSYGDYGSSLSIGWGGLLVDWTFRVGRFVPYVGATIGGGSVENLTLTEKPATDLLPELKTEDGAIWVERTMSTSMPGVFAAGDCTGQPLQIAKAVGEGHVAALSACEYLDSM